MERPDFFSLKNGEKVKLPFSNSEYNRRVNNLRKIMDKNNLDMVILTSMHNIAYYTGFIYCSFGRPYGCLVTKNKISTISANIDASQPWRRSHCDNVIYTDWKRDNFLKAIVSIIGRDDPPKTIGLENDHVTLDMREKIGSIFVSLNEGKITSVRSPNKKPGRRPNRPQNKDRKKFTTTTTNNTTNNNKPQPPPVSKLNTSQS